MITDDDVMRLFEQADPARADDVEPVDDVTEHLAALRTRSSNVTLIDTEPAPTQPDDRRRWVLLSAAAAAVVAVVVGALLVAGGSDSTEQQAPDGTSVPTTTTATSTTVASRSTMRDAAVELGVEFLEARDAYDGERVRSLLTDDAVINDRGRRTPDDYIQMAEYERVLGWRFHDPQCLTTNVGPPIEVSCAYWMEDSLTRALGAPGLQDFFVDLVISDGRVVEVDHATGSASWEYDQEQFKFFADWVHASYPGDVDVMFDVQPDGEETPALNPEALALWERRVSEFPQVAMAVNFIQARDRWDAATVRSLVADDIVIHDFGVVSVDDYPANIEFDRAIGWRFRDPKCRTTNAGPPTEVICTYKMEDAWSQALGVGPYRGSTFEFVIVDGRIQQLTHTFDDSLYNGEVLEVFVQWLDENHPGDAAKIFTTSPNGETVRNLTPEAITLVKQRTAEFVAAQSD